MSVNYVIVEKKNPSDGDAANKYNAHAKSRGELTFRKLRKEIAEVFTTVSDSDDQKSES